MSEFGSADMLAQLRRAAATEFRAGNFFEAERLIGEALTLAPNSAELWSNRGSAHAAMKQREEALACFDRALGIDPNLLGARANRANLLFELGRFAESIPDFDRLLAHDPERAYANGNRLFAKLNCCDWTGFSGDRNRILSALRSGKPAVPPALSIALLESPADQRHAAEIVARGKYPPRPPLWRGERYAHDRIRVAYLSADFHAHATATLAAGLFEAHDRTRFESFAISYGPDDGSAMRARLVRGFAHFVDVRELSDADVATLVRRLEIDIAVDLKAYTSDARPGILAHRPAPVQISYLGFPSTMGAPFIDYVVADPVVIADQDARFYSERIIRLPHSYQPNDRTRAFAERAPSRAEAGLPEDAFVFCCFNASFKILPDIFAAWMRLLAQVEGSVLWLLADDISAANLRREAQGHGIAPERLRFAPRMGPEDHLARHRLADLFLDTHPYNAHTTASDALWMGLPLVTYAGETFASRVAAGVLDAAGVPELATRSLADYERLALGLARDPVALARLKTKLEQNRATCPLFDIAGYARHLEWAYREIHERSQSGEPPGDVTVPASA